MTGTLEILSLLRDRRLWRGPFVWTLLIVLALNPLASALIRYRERQAGIELAAVGRLAEDPATSKRPVRYDWSISDHFETFLHYIPDSRNTHLAILSGMSQMYTINDYHPGDQTISEWMDDALAPRGVRVFGLAAPNLSHEEALFLPMATAMKPETHPDAFIFAVAFEKLREVDLRRQYLTVLRAHPELAAEWRKTAERYRTKYPLASAKMLATLAQQQQDDTIDDTSFEARLRQRVSRVAPLIGERRQLNAEMRIHLFGLRNALLGIKNTTKRPIIRDRYDTNREFLGMLVDLGRERGTDVMLYVVPFNPHAENPYIPEEYSAFKTWLTEFARETNTPLANLENAVPSSDWGLFLGGPDFKHFRGAGHKRTADALLQNFSKELVAR
ncbi:MAG TPA: hypothetical protein VF215_09810 [Thermoanaerobaculia bacterium]